MIGELKHGYACQGKRHPLYHIWAAMKARCYNPNARSYEYYGARGIAVCDRWENSFPHFLSDILAEIGARPEGLALGRTNTAGNYESGNIQWSTAQQLVDNSRAGSEETRTKQAARCGHEQSQAARNAVSAALRGRPQKPEFIAKRAALQIGKPLSAAHRQAIRAARVGKKHSAERRAAISAGIRAARDARRSAAQQL